MTPAQIALACAALREKAEMLSLEIERFANEGNILECDIRHGMIGTLEHAQAILLGEY
jgi:hypothetical protein